MAKVNTKSKLAEWQKMGWYGGTCPKCKNNFPFLTVEHIIPVDFLKSCGLYEVVENDEENFELLCKGCNGIKSNRIDPFHPKTLPLLKKYVGMIEEKYKNVFATNPPLKIV